MLSLMLKMIMKLMKLLILLDKLKSFLVIKMKPETGTIKEKNGTTTLIIESPSQTLQSRLQKRLLSKAKNSQKLENGG